VSIDLPSQEPVSRNPAYEHLKGQKIKDLIIVFQGPLFEKKKSWNPRRWNEEYFEFPEPGGSVADPGNPDVLDPGLANRLSNNAAYDARREVNLRVWNGSVRLGPDPEATQRCVTQALEATGKLFDPRGMLYVVGASAGGADAIQLCQLLEKQMGRFEVSTGGKSVRGPFGEPGDMPVGRFLSGGPPIASGGGRPNVGTTRIDKLFLLDGALNSNPAVRARQQSLPAAVRAFRNYYQTKENDPTTQNEWHDKVTDADGKGEGNEDLTDKVPAPPQDPHRWVVLQGKDGASRTIERELLALVASP
jgi:hypothetical protein